jgi:aminoglycoside phosphotransferase (APT) family kinase protein
MVFADDQALPAAFIKATCSPARAEALQCEYDNLTYLLRQLPQPLSGTVPRPLYFGRLDGYVVLAQSAGPGQRMKNFWPDSYFRSNRYRTDFQNVIDWLVEFQRALAGVDLATDPRGSPARPEQEIAAYRGSFRVSSRLDELLVWSAECLKERDYVLSPWHGDFCTANILVADRKRICVIDWEQRLSRSWPLMDLLYFLSSLWCVPYRKGINQRALNYRQLFFGEHDQSTMIRAAGRRIANELEIDARDLVALSTLVWVVFANRKLAWRDPESQRGGGSSHRPLIMLRDQSCLNLELLATHRDRYVFTR